MKKLFRLLALVICLSSFALAAPTLVQSATAEAPTGTSSLTATLSSTATVGNLLVAVVVNYNAASVSSVVDTNASGLTPAVTQNTQAFAAIYYEVVSTSGVHDVAVNLTFNNCALIIAEYSGVVGTTPLDVTSANDNGFSPAGTAVTSNSTTTLAAAGELAIGAIVQWRNVFPTLSVGSGWTSRAIVASGNVLLMDQVPSTTTGLATTGTVSPSTNSQTYALIATFKVPTIAAGINCQLQGNVELKGNIILK